LTGRAGEAAYTNIMAYSYTEQCYTLTGSICFLKYKNFTC